MPTAARLGPPCSSPRAQRKLHKTHSPQTGGPSPGSTEFPHLVDPGACKVAFKVVELPVPLPAEDLRLEYRLYDKYQRRVHGDKETVSLRGSVLWHEAGLGEDSCAQTPCRPLLLPCCPQLLLRYA